MADFYPSEAKTTKRILMKLGMVDYVRDPTPHDNFAGASATWVVWANMCLVTSPSFFSFFLSLVGKIITGIGLQARANRGCNYISVFDS